MIGLLLFFTLGLSLAQNSTGGGCDFFDVLPDDQFLALLNSIQAHGSSSDRVKVVKDWCAGNNTYGLSSVQTTKLLSLFSFSDDRLLVIGYTNKFILTLSVEGLVSIIKTGLLSTDKLQILRILVNLTSQVDLKANTSLILDCYSFSSDKATAQKIIDDSNPRSCLFGPADIPRFAFIIDISGSMSEVFTDTDGTRYTRLQYVQKDLIKVMNSTLRPSQELNIISFSTNAGAWRPGVVPVNYANIVSASAYVKQLTPGGGTYMLGALRLAFSDPKVLGVYFLSDGDPSDSSGGILRWVTDNKKPVNTVAFKAGKTASDFMKQISQACGGTFRAIA